VAASVVSVVSAVEAAAGAASDEASAALEVSVPVLPDPLLPHAARELIAIAAVSNNTSFFFMIITLHRKTCN